jgi:endoglucanase Acf2
MLQVSYPANHRKEEPKAIHDYFFPDLKIQLIEEITSRHIQSFDALSVTLRLSTEDGHLETYLVQGSPYITLQYAKTTPVIRAFSIFTSVTCPPNDVKFGVCNSEDAADQTTWLQGVQFILQTQEGVSWMVFASEPITLRFDRVSKTTVTASDSFSGILRLAIIPPETTETSSTTTKPAPNQTSTMNNGPSTKSSGLQRLIYHAGVYPVSGRVSWSFGRAGTSDASVPSFSKTMTALAGSSAAKPGSSSKSAKQTGRIGTIEFKFETRTFAKTGSSATTPKPLLMLALPHHAQSLPESIQLGLDMFDLVYKCIKGPMRPILGTTWSYDEPLPSLGFDGDSGSSFSEKHFRAPGVRLTILKSLKQDVDLFKPTPTENIYGFGKQSARLAQLAHVASNLLPGNKTTDEHTEPNHEDKEIADILEYAKSTLRSSLERLLTSNVSDTLVYDANLGGMVTKDGLMNSEADFGNGRFNVSLFVKNQSCCA